MIPSSNHQQRQRQRQNDAFGPWATALDTGPGAALSTFWRRRMAMLQTVNANEGRTSWRMLAMLLIGGLAMLALPAVYLSRATAVQAEDPPKAVPPQAEHPFGEDAKAKPAKDPAGDNPFGGDTQTKPAGDASDNPFGSADDDTPAPEKHPTETPRARATAADESPYTAPPRTPSVSFERAAEPRVEFLPEPSQGEKQILAALDRKVTLDFTEQPLVKVVAFLADVLEQKVPIQLDYRALDDAGVPGDTPVTRTVKDVKLRTALKLLLDEYDLTYLIRDDVMLITTQDKAETELTTRTYPVGDLVQEFPAGVVPGGGRAAPKGKTGTGMFQIADAPLAPAIAPPAATTRETKVTGPYETPQPSVAPKSQKSESKPQMDYDTLINAIISTVNPQTWDEVGGPGSIKAVPVASSLVISQTRDVHDGVLDLIRSLRAAKRASSKQSAATD
jgi:hypothetical protein